MTTTATTAVTETVVSKPMSRSEASRKANDLTYSTNIVHRTRWTTDGKWMVVRIEGAQFGCLCSGTCDCQQTPTAACTTCGEPLDPEVRYYGENGTTCADCWF